LKNISYNIRPKRSALWLVLAVTYCLIIPAYAQGSSPTDDIVVKATNAVIYQMTANLKLTQGQITAVRPIIADNIVKTRVLQQSLEDGNIDGKTMYNQRQQLINEEYRELGSVLTPDQLKLWISIQNDQ